MKFSFSTPFFGYAFNLRLAGRRALFIFAALLLIGIQTIIFSGRASAAAPYLASDVLGQTAENGVTLFNSSFSDAHIPTDYVVKTPRDTAIDTVNHRFFVSDYGSDRVLVYDLDINNQLIDDTADYVLGHTDFTSFNGGTSSSQLNGPTGLDYDSTRNLLFVADYINDRVLIFDVTSITNGENAVNVLGQADFTSHDTNVDASSTLTPSDLTYDETNQKLYVASSANNSRVTVFDLSTITDDENAVNVLGQADFTSTGADTNAKGFAWPDSIDIDETGQRLFVGDGVNRRVLIFDVSTIIDNEDAINVLGQANFTSNAFDTNAKGFRASSGIAYDSVNDYLYVSDSSNSRVLVFDVSTIIDNEDAINVLGQADFVTLGADTNAQGFNGPGNITIDPISETLYVIDANNERVLIFDTAAITDNENAVNVIASPDLTSASGITLPNANGFYYSKGVSIDENNHRLFVSDDNGRVSVFNLDSNNNLLDYSADYVLGKTSMSDSTLGVTQNLFDSGYIGGTAYDPVNDRLFVHDSYNCRVLVFDVSSITNGQNATHVLGQVDFTSNTCDVTQSNIDYTDSGDLSFDPENQLLFVEDYYYNGRVMIFDVDPNVISNGMNASYVIGKSDFVTSGGTGGQNGICDDEGGVYYSTTKKWLFTSDCNNRILIFDLSSGITNGMNASYVLGQTDFVTYTPYTGGSIDQAGLYYPEGLVMDEENGLLYVAEQNRRILVFDVNSITNFEPAVAVLGQPDFASNVTGTSQSEIAYNYEYSSLAYDHINNRLYYPDMNNSRVLIFDFIKIDTPTLPISEPGEAFSQNVAVSNDQGTVSYAVTSGSLPAGLSLDTGSGAITGTPSVQGTFDFTVTATDDNGTAGYFFDKQDYSLKITDDYDSDGNKNVDERDTPFGNDLNNDATPDWQQSTVSITKNNAVSGAYIASSVSNCPAGFTAFTSDAEEDLSAQDDDYTYPLGMQTFTAECGTNGITADFTIYYDKEYDTSNWMYRKYTPALGYFDFSNQVTYGTETVNGKTVTTASFSVTDGSAFDADGVANGTIIDPVGPAVLGALAETGGSYLDDAFLSVSLILAVFIVAHITRDRVYRLRRN